jgi:hypothetical protein
MGVSNVLRRNALGMPTYFFGEVRRGGHWLFFPTVILVKTPIPFLVLLAVGVVALLRLPRETRTWRQIAPLAAGSAVLVATLPSKINIGLRHVLPVYPFFAVVAGFGLVALVRARSRRSALRCALAVLLVWLVVSSARAHPDYLPYFNELAGSHPERILADSDLDWGQDVKRLLAVTRTRNIESLAYKCLGCTFLELDGAGALPGPVPMLTALAPYRPLSGWVAISEYAFQVDGEILRQDSGQGERAFDWLVPFEYERIGRSIRLYRVPAAVDRGGVRDAPVTPANPG